MKREEWIFQCRAVNALRLAKFLVFAVPNGGSRNIREAANLKRSGVLAGAPDLVVAKDGQVWFLEIKTQTGRQSPAQKEFQAVCESEGLVYLVISDFAGLEKFINDNKKIKIGGTI